MGIVKKLMIILGLSCLGQAWLKGNDASVKPGFDHMVIWCKRVLAEHGVDADQEGIRFAQAPDGNWQANHAQQVIYVPQQEGLISPALNRLAVLHEYSHIRGRRRRNFDYHVIHALPIVATTLGYAMHIGMSGEVDPNLYKLMLYPAATLTIGLTRVTRYLEEEQAEKSALNLMLKYPSAVNEDSLKFALHLLRNQQTIFAKSMQQKWGICHPKLLEAAWFLQDEHPSFARHIKWYEVALKQVTKQNLARQSQIDRATDQEWEELVGLKA